MLHDYTSIGELSVSPPKKQEGVLITSHLSQTHWSELELTEAYRSGQVLPIPTALTRLMLGGNFHMYLSPKAKGETLQRKPLEKQRSTLMSLEFREVESSLGGSVVRGQGEMVSN